MLVKDLIEAEPGHVTRNWINWLNGFYDRAIPNFCGGYFQWKNETYCLHRDALLAFDLPDDFGDVEIDIDNLTHFAFFKGSSLLYMQRYFRTYKRQNL